MTLSELIDTLSKYADENPKHKDLRITIATEGFDSMFVSDVNPEIKKQFYITDSDYAGQTELFDTERELEVSSERRIQKDENWYAEEVLLLTEVGELITKNNSK